MAEINLGEGHWASVNGRLALNVNVVNKNAHPLLSGAMRIDSSARFSRCLDLNTVHTGFDRVACVYPLHYEIWMPIEVSVLAENARVLCKACCQHIRQKSRHDGRPQHVVQSLQPLPHQTRVDIVEEVVYILHRHFEIGQPELEWQCQCMVECFLINTVSDYCQGNVLCLVANSAVVLGPQNTAVAHDSQDVGARLIDH
jgi:hypothetical protein